MNIQIVAGSFIAIVITIALFDLANKKDQAYFYVSQCIEEANTQEADQWLPYQKAWNEYASECYEVYQNKIEIADAENSYLKR